MLKVQSQHIYIYIYVDSPKGFEVGHASHVIWTVDSATMNQHVQHVCQHVLQNKVLLPNSTVVVSAYFFVGIIYLAYLGITHRHRPSKARPTVLFSSAKLGFFPLNCCILPQKSYANLRVATPRPT